MGGLRTRMKVTFWVYLIGALALAGIFPLAGFWSKDEILAEAFVLNKPVFWMLIVAAFFTAFYMGRQVLMVFFGQPRSEAASHAPESPVLVTAPLIVLAALTVFGGLLNLPGLHTLTQWLEHTFENVHPGEFVIAIAAFASLMSILAITLAWYLYSRRYKELLKIPRAKRPDDPLQQIIGPIFIVFEHKYWVDELYGVVIQRPYIWLSRFLAEQIDWRFWHDWFHDTVIARSFRGLARFLAAPCDLGVIDGIANGLATLTVRLASNLRLIQTGFVRIYALSVFLGVVIILGYLILR
jgi:NADH-quinone oxidoreductase subunit L